MNDTDTRVNIPRLLDLGRWLTREERKRRLGQPSHWSQDVWVMTDTDTIDELPIEVVGRPGGEQPVFVNWSCGTAACAAGHISLEDGGSPAFSLGGGQYSPTPPDSNDPWDWLDTLSSSCMYFGGRVETIEEHAQRTLGLDEGQARLLFAGHNSWEDMAGYISDFTGIDVVELLPLIGAVGMPADPDDDEYDEDACSNGCTCNE